MPREPLKRRSLFWTLPAALLPAALIPLGASAPVYASAPAAEAPVPPASPAPPAVTGTSARVITLVEGDSLWGLAQTYGTTVSALQRANNLGSSTLIYAGDEFVIPGRTIVAPGQSLALIAGHFSVSTQSLVAENGLETAAVSPGETLYIPAQNSSEATPAQAPAASSELLDLAHLIQSEAGNQPFAGQVAVAAVVLNRVRSPAFPNTVAGVIFQPGQFESVSNGTFWMAPDTDAYQAARDALSGQDPTGGALYYYNPSLTDNAWMKALPIIVTIGSQVFCK